jgi:ABC-type multidrug transport system ATPase subunit
MAGILEMKNVAFSAQSRQIVKGFSHEFREGITTALIGSSGCGKSTILKLSAGLLVPDEGQVCYKGKDIFSMNRQENLDFRREASMVFQDSALWANQSLQQILELPLRIHFPEMPFSDRNERITEVLAIVGYSRDLNIRPAQLSMGEQKLIAFARAIICHPKMLFLDEWTESLDDSAARRLLKIVMDFEKAGNTVIIVSHDFKVIKSLADDIILIKEGRYFNNFSREQIEGDEELVEFIKRGIA